MSLTSYRAAPSRVSLKINSEYLIHERPRVNAAASVRAEAVIVIEGSGTSLFARGSGRPGSDLLSHALRRSTIGPGGLNYRVRDGIGWGTPGIAARSARAARKF